MVLENLLIKMELLIKDIGNMVKWMDMENCRLKMVVSFMMENGQKVLFKVKESIITQTHNRSKPPSISPISTKSTTSGTDTKEISTAT